MKTSSNRGKWKVVPAFVVMALIWGLSMVVMNFGLEELAPMEILALRWGVDLVIYVLLILFKVIKVDYKNKPLKPLIAAVLFQPCIYSFLEIQGLSMTTASESSIIIALVPLAVVIESAVFLKEKVSKLLGIGIFMGFTGCIIGIIFGDGIHLGGRLTGYMLLIIAVFAAGGYCIISGKISAYYSTYEISFAMAVAGGIFYNICNFVMGYGTHPYKEFLKFNTTTLVVLYLGVGCAFLCYNLFNYILSQMDSSIVACIQNNALNAVGVVGGIVILHEAWGIHTVVGVAVQIAGIVIAAYAGMKAAKK